nr:DUF6378 domain-containing protein [Nocardia bovistercoris]
MAVPNPGVQTESPTAPEAADEGPARAAAPTGQPSATTDTEAQAAPRPRTVLEEAAALVEGEREDQYGHPAKSFQRIGELWTAYLGVYVSALDVANLMILLKVSRTKDTFHRDSYVDIGGYARSAERIAA